MKVTTSSSSLMYHSKPDELLIATRNMGKLREFKDLFAALPLKLRDMGDFPEIAEIEETGETFAENALLKASGYASQTGLWALADDSGLEVKALDGAPGVFSARFAGERATSQQRNEKVLEALLPANESGRAARFVCVVALATSNGDIVHSETGVCEGRLALTPRGDNGFGYDSIFIPEGYQQTFGELPNTIKRQISHRAQASIQMLKFLWELLKT